MTVKTLRILQVGVPRSGNLWLYNLIEEIIRLGGYQHRSYIQKQSIYKRAKKWTGFQKQAGIDYLEIEPTGYYFRKGKYQSPIDDIQHYIQQCTHIWTHSHWNDMSDTVFRKVDKVVYIIRDPRDIAISSSRYVFTPFMQNNHPISELDADHYLNNRLYEVVLNWVKHVGEHLIQRREIPIYVIFFERLKQVLEAEIQQLASYLEVELDESAVAKVKQQVDFNKMKQENPFHLYKGEYGNWSNILTQNQQNRVAKIAGPMLSLLNYPISEFNQDLLPELKDDLRSNQIRDAIKISRGSIFDQMIYGFFWFKSRRPLNEKIIKGIKFLLQR